jgi:protein-tyrosine phosphatase
MSNPSSAHVARNIRLDGAQNMRDIGGYMTQTGQVTRFGRVLRSDALHALTRADQDVLTAHGIGTTIDLRFTAETRRAPSVFAQSTVVRYLHMPLHEPYPEPHLRADTATLDRYYVHLVDAYAESILDVFETLTDPQALPAIVHCTLGKDRTGVIISLLLSTLGVSDEVVVADYALTAECASGLLDKMRAEALAAGMPAEWCAAMFDSHPDNMRALLAHVRDTYGGAEAYLRAIGLSDARVQRLRANLLA